MEPSKTKTRAIELGKRLVDELGCDSRRDTLSLWMAHYVAQQMVAAQSARGKAKSAAEKRCFQTILSLWQHRASLPNGHRPFEDFEPILRVLAAIDPMAKHPFYHRLMPTRDAESTIEPGTVEAWVDFIVKIDAAARVLIQTALDEACELADNKRTRAFLRSAIRSSRRGDLEIVGVMLARSKESADPRAELIQSRLNQLGAFAKICWAAEKDLKHKLQRRSKMG